MAATIQPCNVLFLAAGYGTRLQRDIESDPSRSYIHLLSTPKALLPLSSTPLLTHWLETSKSIIPPLPRPYIITNSLHHEKFLSWAHTTSFPTTNILNNGTSTNETRSGAVADLSKAIEHFHLKEKDLLVVAGDTLFLRDFTLQTFLSTAQTTPGSLVTCYEIPTTETHKYGIIDTESPPSSSSPQRITRMLEKPQPIFTESRLASPCFYYLKSEALPLVTQFLDGRRAEGASLADIDASGKFVAWLVGRHPVYAVPVSGRLDIGGLESYIEADEYMSNRDN
ncbi:hypothetical protein HK097_011434 [Rhizophlyctis rosea]|uniref:Nucleotidyl transferase domain-containing protein n=1 Tax=Rhizophlyctis rosea TaxID=64517 RepID=A0AAD5X4S6_9FUNG|nr:hypothetical protein HK097_011434 [Rhizophlyctis rosea]